MSAFINLVLIHTNISETWSHLWFRLQEKQE